MKFLKIIFRSFIQFDQINLRYLCDILENLNDDFRIALKQEVYAKHLIFCDHTFFIRINLI